MHLAAIVTGLILGVVVGCAVAYPCPALIGCAVICGCMFLVNLAGMRK